jgi:DNA-directed RNA polymerase subunit RPC12/RpoP
VSLRFTTSEDPYIQCPACAHSWWEDSAFEMSGVDSEIACPKCAAAIVCIEVRVTRHWTWEAKVQP